MAVTFFFPVFTRQVTDRIGVTKCPPKHLGLSNAKLLNSLETCSLCDSIGRQASNLLIA